MLTVLPHSVTPHGGAQAIPARVETSQTTVTSATGATAVASHVAYVEGEPGLSVGDPVDVSNAGARVVLQTVPQYGNGGNVHHTTVHVGAPHSDHVIVTRSAAAGAWEPLTGAVTQPASAVVFDGMGTVLTDGSPATVDAADQQLRTRVLTVLLPLTALDVRAGDRVQVRSVAERQLANVTLVVESVSYGAGAFARVLTCTLAGV